MTADENARPGISIEAEGLVEPEGLNAGSARSAAESAADRPAGAPTGGGRPEAADAQTAAAPERDQIVSTPWDDSDPDAPSLAQSEEEQAVG